MTWYDPAFSYKKALVVPHTNVSGMTDFTDFPLLVSITDTALKSMANGGLVASSSGYDLLFTDSTETRELPYEVESYTASSGALVCWVRVPVLFATADTTIYLYFGNSVVSGFQATASNVWDGHYTGVWHLSEASGTTNADSTSTTSTATKASSSSPAAATGFIAGGQSFDGSTSYETISGSACNITGDKTVECWVKATTFAQDGGGLDRRIITNYIDANNAYQFKTITASPGTGFGWQVNDSGTQYRVSGSGYSTSTWYHVVGTYVQSGHAITLYINGVSVSNGTDGAAGIGTSASLLFGKRSDNAAFFSGYLDEIRISNVARSADWIVTTYINHANTSTFLWVGETIPYTGNTSNSLLVITSSAAAQGSADQVNASARGVVATINVTSLGSGESLTLKVQGKDGATGQYYDIATFSSIGAGVTACTVYPGLTGSSTVASGVVPHTWRVTTSSSPGSNASSYTVGGSLIS